MDFKKTAEELLLLLVRSSCVMTKTGSVGCQATSEHLYRYGILLTGSPLIASIYRTREWEKVEYSC